MSLLDSIVGKTVDLVMVSNKSLSQITSTTFSQTGTSLGGIRSQAVVSATAASGGASVASSLYNPVTAMRDFALAANTNPAQVAAIQNASVNASNAVDSYFGLALPTPNNTIYDVQTAATQSLSNGVTYFGNSLAAINPQDVSGALNVGNNALVSAGTQIDNVCTSAYNAATSSVSGSIGAINSSVAALVAGKSAIGNTTSTLANAASSVTGTATDLFASAGISTVAEAGVAASANNTDTIYQDVKLYIEGIQVPFEAISISQGIGARPTCTIQVPPQAGLMDICRYYQPKVHVFFTDANVGGDRLLFWGHIMAVNYSKSQQDARASISFQCDHKNTLLELVTLEFSGYLSNATTVQNDPNVSQAAAKVNALNSTQSLAMALAGVTGMQTADKDLISPTNKDLDNADTSKLDQRFKNFETRLVGMPGAMMNFWNQLKKECFAKPALNTIMSKMYIPLVEDGLGFFDRLAGHYPLEVLTDTTRQDACPGQLPPAATANKIMIPPAYKLNTISAIQSDLSIKVLQNMMGFSGELDTFGSLFANFYQAIEYEVITLASPAEVPVDATATVDYDSPASWANTPKMAIETIVKPQIPMYYSPICNVVFPKMYHSIQVGQNEAAIPTRITAYSDIVPGSQGNLGSAYRSPGSIREAVSIGIALANSSNSSQLDINLLDTTGGSFNVPGKYEQGRGVKNQRIILPQWLAMLVKDGMSNVSSPNNEALYDKSSVEYKALVDLHAAWIDRYGYDVTTYTDGTTQRVRNKDKDVLDPYSDKSKIAPFQRLMFAASDYEYTKSVMAARSGSLDGIFNPYIVPGYPMEILDDSPNHPCFHAMCASVTHSFTSRSIGTSVGFVGASTYTEMINYFTQPLHPWLQTALKLVNTEAGDSGADPYGEPGYGVPPDDIVVNQTIINNPVAGAQADLFYKSVLGVGCVGIDDIYDFQYGQLVPVTRSAGAFYEGTTTSTAAGTGREQNDFLSAVGNLRLVRRTIEGKNSIQDKFGIQFIDMSSENYSPTAVAYQNPQLDSVVSLEPGASLFLNYDETSVFIDQAKLTSTSTATTNSSTSDSQTIPRGL